MRNRTYGGVRGRETKVGRKLLCFPPTRFARNQNTKSPKTYPVDSYTNCTVSADQVERWIGFDFFVNLPKDIQSNRIGTESFLPCLLTATMNSASSSISGFIL